MLRDGTFPVPGLHPEARVRDNPGTVTDRVPEHDIELKNTP